MHMSVVYPILFLPQGKLCTLVDPSRMGCAVDVVGTLSNTTNLCGGNLLWT